jgi:hypothetical protein
MITLAIADEHHERPLGGLAGAGTAWPLAARAQSVRRVGVNSRSRIAFVSSSATCRDSTSSLRWCSKALEGDNAAVHAEVKVLERRSRMLGLDAPRQLDMTLEVRARTSTPDPLRQAIARMAAQGKISPESQERIRPFGFLPEAAHSAQDDPNLPNVDRS